MKRIDLTMKEEDKYLIIKKLVENNGNKKNAAIKLDCSLRHVNRLIQGYKKYGKEFFCHGNKGRKPDTYIENIVRLEILKLYKTTYFDFNFQHFQEKLKELHGLDISLGSVRNILSSDCILSPMANKSTIRKLIKELEKKAKESGTKKEKDIYIEKIMQAQEAHPRKPRSKYFGEMIQMDASNHEWFGDKYSHLHLALDDSTGIIVGAYFQKEETLDGYYQVLKQILRDYGIPHMFFTDRRTIFEYKNKKSPSVEEDTMTQFSYACKQLGVEIRTSSIPQAKARVERMFKTLQSRLRAELRLSGARTIEQANVFLNSYIKKYNYQFALGINHSKSVFEKQPEEDKINLTLAKISERKIDSGHAIRYKKEYYLPVNGSMVAAHFYKGTKCMVIEALNGEIYTCIDDKIYALIKISSHEAESRYFDVTFEPKIKPVAIKIPSMRHPWKTGEFARFLYEKEKINTKTYDNLIYSQKSYFTSLL